jgi:hypothetical protein
VNIPKKVSQWRFILFTSLLVLAPLSKYPSLSTPLYNFSSFRIGLYQLLAIIFIVLCIKPIYKSGLSFFKSSHPIAFYSVITIVFLIFLGLIRAIYPERSLLMAGSFLVLLLVLIAAWWFSAHEFSKNRQSIVLKGMLYASVIYGVVALVQLIIFTLTNQTLGILCPGCAAEVFGFPRINGFSAEPQFFANAMIPFVFAGLYSVIKKSNPLGWISLISSIFTIGLTFSRGAYIAIASTIFFIGIALLIRKHITFKKLLAIYFVTFIAIILSLGTLILMATIRYNDSPNISYETLDSITEHLTLGVINLPESRLPDTDNQNQMQQAAPEESFVSPGLIESSNQERTSAAQLALKAWASTIITSLAGVGLGNLGPYVVNNIDISAPENLTVYIFYVLFLAELGIFGLVALLLIFGSAIVSLIKANSLEASMMNGRLVAFAVQFLFFGSYINVVYIWLWVGIALGATSVVSASKTKKRYTKD